MQQSQKGYKVSVTTILRSAQSLVDTKTTRVLVLLVIPSHDLIIVKQETTQ